MRLVAAAVALLVIAQIAVYSPRALPSMILAAALVVAILAVEETRVHRARDAEDYARERVCHHGGTDFQAGDGDDYARSQVGRKR